MPTVIPKKAWATATGLDFGAITGAIPKLFLCLWYTKIIAKLITKGVCYMSPFWIYILANLGLFSLIRFVTSFSHWWQYRYWKKRFCYWCGGVVVVHLLWLMVWFHSKFFISHPVECMNSYNIWIRIYDEFSMNSYIFCTLNIWTHINMNSYYVWIHIFFAVIMYTYEFIYFLQCKIKAASARELRARAASTQRRAWIDSQKCRATHPVVDRKNGPKFF